MFSAAVNVSEGLLVPQWDQILAFKCLLQDLHHHHVLVDRPGRLSEDRGDLVLVGGNFLVPGLDGHSDCQKLVLGLPQHSFDFRLQLGVVVV